MHKSIAFFAIILLIAGSSAPLWAAPPAGDTASSAKKEPTPAEFEEAGRRYNRAIELFNEGSYDASLLEFRRSYELAPSYKILYNIALVNVQLNDYAQALDYFERYVKEGGSEVPAPRQEEVKKEIERLTTRVALVMVKTNVDGAQISVDDLNVGNSPLDKPLRVNAGRRRITVAATGKMPRNKVIELAGGDNLSLDFDLKDPEASGGPSADSGPTHAARPIPWPAWAGAAVLAIGAGVTGVLALRANGDLKDEKGRPVSDPAAADEKASTLDDLETKRKRYALATDILAGAAIVTGGIALYLTLKQPSDSTRKGSRAPRLQIGLGGASIHGAF